MAGGGLWSGMTIRGRLLLLALAMLVPYVLLVALDTYVKRAQAVERSLADCELEARRIAAQLGGHVAQVQSLLTAVGTVVGEDLDARARNDDRLRRLAAGASRAVSWISIVDTDGRITSSSAVPLAQRATVNMKDRDYFRTAVQTRAFAISAPIVARTTGEWIVIMASPILDENQAVRAVAVAVIELDQFGELVNAMRADDASQVVVTSDRGRVLLQAPSRPASLGVDASALPQFRVARAGGAYKGETRGMGGVRMLGASAPVGNAPWQLFYGVPYDRVLADLNQRLMENLAIAGAMLSMAVAAAWWIGRGLTQPIRLLQRGVNRLAGGALDHRIELRGARELRELAADVNRMAQALAESEKALRDERDQLDRHVAERTAELEALLREMQAFSYSVAHDLRSPLGVISGFAHVVAKEERDRLSPDGKRLLGVIEANVAYLVELVDDLLTLAQVNRAEIARAPLDMRAIAGATLEEQRQKYPGAAIQVGEMPATEGDATLVRQVFSNLVENALKYCSRVAAPRVEVGWNDAQRAYYVRDNGAGFDMKHARRMFGAFERLHDAGEFPGTGIGLAIVKRVIERHDGRVWAESAPGKGATFYFSLAA